MAAVYGDRGKNVGALKLYEEVLCQEAYNPYALRGIARVYANLGRYEEAAEAYEKAAHKGKLASGDLQNLLKIRETLKAQSRLERVEWIDSVIENLRA